MRRRRIAALAAVLVLTGAAPGVLGGTSRPASAAEGDGGDRSGTEAPTSPAATPVPSPTPAPPPSPSPSPTPEPSPTEDCLAGEEGTVSFGDVDRDCDGTLLLSEQGDPISIERTVELAPEDLPAEEAAAVGETEDRFEPTDFVPGVLVGFDETSEQGGTIREGSLVYTPPAGFVGEDRYTFRVRGEDGIVRQAEVVVDVRYAELAAPDAAPTATPQAAATSADTVDRALPDTVELVEADERWEPPWLALLVTIAGLLLSVAVAWWMFLVVRIQERRRQA